VRKRNSKRASVRTDRNLVYKLVAGAIFILLLYRILAYPSLVNPYFELNIPVISGIFYMDLVLIYGSMAFLGLQMVRDQDPGKVERHIFILACCGIGILYVLSFNPILAPNGDNAEYIINAKSLVEKGAAYRLDTPTETRNTLASMGLPFLLSSVYAGWGIDIVKMKLVVLLFAFFILPALFYLYRLYLDFFPSALLTLVTFSSPYLISSSSSIMTEIPYLFWSLITLYVVQRYSDSKTLSWGSWVALFLLFGVTYTMRAVGSSLTVAAMIFFFVKVPWSELFKKHFSFKHDATGRANFLKFLSVVLPVVFLAILWKSMDKDGGISQLELFLNFDWKTHLLENGSSLHHVLGQSFLSSDTFRWFRQSPSHSLPIGSVLWLVIELTFLLGLIIELRKKNLLSIYVLCFLAVILLASMTPQEGVIMRYILVSIPLLVYHFYKGAVLMISWSTSRINVKQKVGVIATLAIILQMMAVNLDGNRYNVFTRGDVYNAYYESFLQAARWCGENLPEDAYILSVKPRIVYVVSGRKGLSIGSDVRTQYSAEYEASQLARIKSNKITHIIVDAISSSTMDNFYPVINNNKDKFEVIDVPNLNNKCTILRVLPF